MRTVSRFVPGRLAPTPTKGPAPGTNPPKAKQPPFESAYPARLHAGSIVPGQRIPIVWSYVSHQAARVIGRVYLDATNESLWESPQVDLIAQPSGLFSTGSQDGLIEFQTGRVASDLYAIGARDLRLDVILQSTGEVIASETAGLDVLPDTPGAVTFPQVIGSTDSSAASPRSQIGVDRREFIINHPFTIFCRFENTAQSPNTILSGRLELVETDASNGTDQVLQVHTLSNLHRDAPDSFFFDPITRNWDWFFAGIFVRDYSAPLIKTYYYYARFTVYDTWGNVYPDLLGAHEPYGLIIDICVSDEKRAYLDAALAALGVALIASIWGYFTGSTAIQQTADALGARALDPPIPDRHFRERVSLPAPARHETENSEVDDLRELVARSAHIVSLLDGLATIRDRIYGASLARDESSLELQRDTYVKAEAALQQAVLEFQHSANRARRIAGYPALSRDRVGSMLRAWQRSGLPHDVQQGLALANASDRSIRRLDDAVRSETIVATATDVAGSISRLAISLALAAGKIHDNVARVLAGDPNQP